MTNGTERQSDSCVTYREPSDNDYFGEYIEGEREAGYWHEDASGRQRVITIEESPTSTLGKALVAFIRSDPCGSPKYWKHGHRILVTTEGWWSGYSEYTVTSTWETVVVTCPERNWERRWETPAALFDELATVPVSLY